MAKRKTNLILLALLAVAIALLGYIQIRQSTKPVSGTSFLMNTVVEYKLYGKNAQKAKDQLEQALTDIENKMSMYKEASEISLLNQKSGVDFVPLSQDTFALLARCVGFGNRSEGVFDVTIAPLIKEWRITSENPKVPDAQKISDLLKLVDYRDILLNGQDFSAKLARKGQAVDLGGIAKGYASDVLRRVAKENGISSGYVSIGGNLMVIGAKPGGEPFKFGVRDPRGGANDYIAVITLPDSTMSTSGDYERYFEQDGVRYHHILDPKTGSPALTDLISVSVVTPDGAYADFMSTYLLIKGKEFTLANLDSLNCGLIVVDKDKNVYVSKSLKGSFTPSDDTGAYHFVTES
ncbi:FAD:protein FMN transferase [Oscillospiraceae bacterium PP1C4]